MGKKGRRGGERNLCLKMIFMQSGSAFRSTKSCNYTQHRVIATLIKNNHSSLLHSQTITIHLLEYISVHIMATDGRKVGFH